MFVNGSSLIRTRFFTSTYGCFHVGDIRTALFNYFFAKRYDGSFTLPRSNKKIQDGLKWLGINWDEGPCYRDNKAYEKVAVSLIESGHAYPDPASGEARGTHRNLTPANALELYYDSGWQIRFKIQEDSLILDDLIVGKKRFDTSQKPDPVIIYTDGSPSENFRTAVDDAHMKITHVIRSSDLEATPTQVFIIHAMGYMPPFYAHLPLLSYKDNKLSKRKILGSREQMRALDELGNGDATPATLDFYQTLGFKPNAIINYLVRLDNDMASLESLKKISLKKPKTQFSPQELLELNYQYMQEDVNEGKTLCCLKFLRDAGVITELGTLELLHKLRRIVELCNQRIKCYSDILTYATFFFKKPTAFDSTDVNEYITSKALCYMDVMTQFFRFIREWNSKSILEQTKKNIKDMKDVVFAIRVALCGSNLQIPLFRLMEILGKDECLSRLYYFQEKFGGRNSHLPALSYC